MEILQAALLLAALGSSAPSVQQAPRAGEEAVLPQGFALPETRGALTRLDEARRHLAAGRLRPAIENLQALLEAHAGDVLGASRPEIAGRPSLLPVHRGAAARARELLLALPSEGRALYRERYEEPAGLALARAIETRDRAALCEIARRWPLCSAAARAWLATGDLELEGGQPRAALAAWQKALELALVLDAPGEDGGGALGDPARWKAHAARALPLGRALAEAAARRGAELSERFGEQGGEADSLARMRGELRLAGEGEGLGRQPGRGADVWPNPLRIPLHDFSSSGSIFPVRAGDVVLVTNSMRLIAADAFTGERLWDSGEVPGWERFDPARRKAFSDGLDKEHALIAPAASGRIAVAALQIPITHIEPESYQRIAITRILPDRRLFAFDLQSGRPLWNHLPAPGWDGESGGFETRMRVAGPPVIAGSRVLAPMVRMQGRIDYHVGCFDLTSGALLWSTALISGQRETNMFGRALWEFSAPPLRVEGERVLALTQLGAIAALDLHSGEILWEALYDQIPLPKGRQYEPTQRRPTWRNAPPVVADGLVLATPVDGDDLVALDLESGAVAWSLRRERLRLMVRRDARLDLLLGADERTVYLAGDRIAALEAPAGLRHQPPAGARWVFEDEALESVGRYRPVLARDSVVVPTSSARIEIDRAHGKRTLTAAWAGGAQGATQGGNLLVDEGALFKASGRDLTGYLEWETLLARARREAAERPDDPRAALVLAERLAGRGLSLWRAEGKSDEARRALAEARELLERFAPPGAEGSASVSRELFGVLRAEARVRADLADTAGATRLLERATQIAPSREALRDVLIDRLSLLEPRANDPERDLRSALLATLEREAGELALLCDARAGDVAIDGSGPLPALVPRGEELAAGDTPRLSVPVGLWVGLERARLAAERQDVAAELEALGDLLRRHGQVSLGEHSAGELAARRVAVLLAVASPAALEAFEAEARLRLTRALDENDRAGLAAVARGWPHSAAAREANDALLERAQDEHDLGEVAAIVRSELSQDFRPEEAGARELALCLRLARAAERGGNTAFADGLRRRLAAAQPEARSPLAEDGGRTLAALAPGARASRLEQPGADGFGLAFDSSVVLVGEHELLGRLALGADGARAGLLVGRAGGERGAELLALAEEGGARAEWSFAEPDAPRVWGGRVALGAGRVLVATHARVLGLDASDGGPRWSFAPEGLAPQGVSVEDGVALVNGARGDERRELVALDARGGAELWRLDVSDPTLYRRPLVGEGRVVLLPNPPHTRLVVLDLFTGCRAFELELPTPPKDAGATLLESAWIEDGLLVLPWFLETRYPERNHVLAIDLARGRMAWRLPLSERDGPARALHSIVQHEERTFLVLFTVSSAQNPLPQGELRELVVSEGTLSAPLFGLALASGDQLVGVGKSERVLLPTPQLFVKAPARGGRATLLRAIHLGQGERWTHVLPVPPDDIYATKLPLPAVSESTVAFAYTEFRRRDRSARPVTSLVLVDARTGVARDARILSEHMGRHEDVTLVPLGATLFVRGAQQLEILR